MRDVLPLYFENMMSEETAAFVKGHLETYPDCARTLIKRERLTRKREEIF